MIDHITIPVSNYEVSKKFYINTLAPLGYKLLMEVEGFAGFGLEQNGGPIAAFWIHEAAKPSYQGHFAFTAQTHQGVDAFYQAALQAGGRDNGQPGIRAEYHPHYYGAFVFDPDGYNIEAVCHKSYV